MTKRLEIIRLNDYPATYQPNQIYFIKKLGTLRIALSNENGSVVFENEVGGGGGGGLTLANDTTTNTSYYPMMSAVNSGLASNGKVSDSKLYFNPSSGVLNSNNFNTLSDRLKKKNLEPILYPIEKLALLTGYTYKLVDGDINSVGLIAQEVEQIFPELVNTNEEGIKSLNYNGIIALLVSGFNAQQKTIQTLADNLSKKLSTQVY